MGAFVRMRPSVPAVRRLPRWAGRAARLALLLVATSMATFALVAVSPIDPVKANLGQAAYAQMSEAQRAQLAEYWGATTPLPARYAHWAASALRGDFGQSLRFGRPVVEVVGERFANSAALMASAWLLAGVLGLALGVLAGSRRGSRADRAICCVCYALSSMPSFWLGLVALMVFSVWLGWFPLGFSVPVGVAAADVTFADALHHMALPAITLSVVGVANVALHTRAKAIDVLNSDYVRFARARGLTRREALIRHGLCNLALPAITLQFSQIAEIFGGSVLVEEVFSYPGLGQAAVTAGLGGDVALLAGIALVSAALVFTGNLAANLIYGLVDPRMRPVRRQKEAADD